MPHNPTAGRSHTRKWSPVNLRQDYAPGFYALGESLAQKGLRKEAAAALRDYLARESDTPDTHQRIERARAHLKELGS